MTSIRKNCLKFWFHEVHSLRSLKDKPTRISVPENCVGKSPAFFRMLANHFLDAGFDSASIPDLCLYYLVFVSHEVRFRQTVYQFSKVEKISLEMTSHAMSYPFINTGEVRSILCWWSQTTSCPWRSENRTPSSEFTSFAHDEWHGRAFVWVEKDSLHWWLNLCWTILWASSHNQAYWIG